MRRFHQKFPILGLLCALLALTGPLRSQDSDEERAQRLNRVVTRLSQGLGEAPHPGAALAVVERGQVRWFEGVGCAQLENELPITRQSSFRLASTSKQFTAAAIALLESRGEIDLDTDIHRWFPKLPDYGHEITVRHLVHHTSGIRDYLWLHVLEGIGDADLVTPQDSLAMIRRQRALDFTPGSRFSYSNSNYLLLAEIVARVSKTSFREFVESQIFAPLEMKTARVMDDRGRILPHRTTGYLRTRDGWRRFVTPLEHVGDGGVFASIDDLAKWDAHFYAPILGKDADLPQRQRRKGPFDGYAFGLMRETWRDQEVEMHGGAFVGYRAEILRFPQRGISIICLGNHARFNPTGTAFQLASAWFGDELPPPKTAPERAKKKAESPPAAKKDVKPLPKDVETELKGQWTCVEFEKPCRIAYENGVIDLFFGEQQLRLPHLDDLSFGGGGFRVEFLRAGAQLLGFTLQRDDQPPHVYRRLES
jgi:CubicO group peptidase (beta-lactamase class C family)